jgi:hypothetical protein
MLMLNPLRNYGHCPFVSEYPGAQQQRRNLAHRVNRFSFCVAFVLLGLLIHLSLAKDIYGRPISLMDERANCGGKKAFFSNTYYTVLFFIPLLSRK